MKQRTVLLILESDRVELVTLRGRSVQDIHTLATEFDPSEETLRNAIRKLKPALASASEELGLTSSPCRVYYRSPSAVVHLTSSPTSNQQSAVQAARLALHEALGFSEETASCDAAFLCRDGAGKTSHTLAVGDRSQITTALAELVQGAGFRFKAAVPIDALPQADLVRRAASIDTPNPTVLLHLGLHSSVLAVVQGRSLTLFRPLAFSVDQLLCALRKPFSVQTSADVAAEVASTIDRATAIEWLSRFGVPDREEVIDDSRGVTGASVRPALQPILQRLVTEIRQSIRFGVAEERRQQTQIELDGAARGIRNLAATLHHELSLPVDVREGEAAEEAGYFGHARRLCAEDVPAPVVSLLPHAFVDAAKLRRFKRHLWSGVAAAGLLLALDAGLLFQKTDSAQRALEPLETTVNEQARVENRQSLLYAATQASFRVENRVAEQLATQPAVSALMRSLSLMTPPRVRLLNLEMRTANDSPTALIEGYADAGGRGGGEVIRGYIADIEALPGVRAVELSSVQDVNTAGSEVQQFRLSLELHPPARPLRSGQLQRLLAAAAEETP